MTLNHFGARCGQKSPRGASEAVFSVEFCAPRNALIGVKVTMKQSSSHGNLSVETLFEKCLDDVMSGRDDSTVSHKNLDNKS